MPRVISLVLPEGPTDRLRRQAGGALPAEAPLAVAGREGGRRVLTAVDATARGLGLRAGMAVAQAQALVPALILRPADPAADRAALDRLALWMLERVAPVVAVDPPDGIVIEVTGAAHLHGGEAALLAALVARLAAAGLTARAAVADSWGAAHALARFAAAPTVVAPPGRQEALLTPLPLAALRLAPATVAGLRELGFATIGDLLGQPRAPLTRRFGPELLRRLDQARGYVGEPIAGVRPEGLIEIRRAFAEPIGAAETIARAISQLTDALCADLAAQGLGARRLDLLCDRVDGRRQGVRVGLARPRRDARHLTRLLCDRIETIDPGFGIEAMTLAAPVVEPLPARQAASALGEAPMPDLSGLIDTLANRIGARAVYRMAPVASDVPERSVTRVAPLTGGERAVPGGGSPWGIGPGASPPPGAGPSTGPRPAHWLQHWPPNWPRPVRLLARPEPIETLALLPDHPPAWIAWRGIRRRILRADGPERIFGEWWLWEAELHALRDYFRVEDETGARYWIFRAGDGEDPATGAQRWFLHGIFA